MKIAPIYDPTQRRPSPKPVQVDLRKAQSEMALQSMFICSYGVLIGFALLVWEHFHRRDYRRLGAD